MRTLGRHADTAKVNALQARLSGVRREFEAIARDCAEERLDHQQHRFGVERLLVDLVKAL